MEEFKELFMFCVSLIMAAFVISLIALLGSTSRQMADIRQSELDAIDNVKIARQYSAYDNKSVTGADVIALMRENSLTGELQIYVNKNINNASLTMNQSNYTSTSWKLSSLLQTIKADAKYLAILVYGNDDVSTAAYSASSSSMITGVKFTLT